MGLCFIDKLSQICFCSGPYVVILVQHEYMNSWHFKVAASCTHFVLMQKLIEDAGKEKIKLFNTKIPARCHRQFIFFQYEFAAGNMEESQCHVITFPPFHKN